MTPIYACIALFIVYGSLMMVAIIAHKKDMKKMIEQATPRKLNPIIDAKLSMEY